MISPDIARRQTHNVVDLLTFQSLYQAQIIATLFSGIKAKALPVKKRGQYYVRDNRADTSSSGS